MTNQRGNVQLKKEPKKRARARTKNPAAVLLGQAGGKARLKTMTLAERSDLAAQASRSRFQGKKRN